jgi:EGF-domain serine glucosyl/xylosyltransferase
MTKSKLIYFLVAILSCQIAYGQELMKITPESFIDKNPSVERKEIVDFLVRQFDDRKITQAQIDKLWNNREARTKFMMSRFQIVDQQVYADSYNVSHYYFPTLLDYFQHLVQKYKIKDVDFIIYLREEIPMQEELSKVTQGIASFMMFRDKNSIYETDKFLFPDAFFLKKSGKLDWSSIAQRIKEAKNNNAWNQKIDKVFWRGATTGDFYDYNIRNFDKLPRLTSVILSALYPDLIDSRFSSYSPQVSQDQSYRDIKKVFSLLFKQDSNRVNAEGHLKYKYLLSMDGNAATGTRVAWIMLSNSVLFKQETNKMQWYYSALKPYVNYVPLNKRLTNIFSQIQWMKANDAEIRQISNNAQEFTENNLMPEHIEAHIVLLLNEYAKIQQDKKIVPTLPAADDTISIISAMRGFLDRAIKRFRD